MSNSTADKRILRSPRIQPIDFHDNQFVPLILVSPDHGSVRYIWERRIMLKWEAINVPDHTCVLYVNTCGMYKCTVAGQEFRFEIKGKYCH